MVTKICTFCDNWMQNKFQIKIFLKPVIDIKQKIFKILNKDRV